MPSRLVTRTIPASPATGRSHPRPSATQVPAPASTCGSSALSITSSHGSRRAARRCQMTSAASPCSSAASVTPSRRPSARIPAARASGCGGRHPPHLACRAAAPERCLQRQPGLPASAQAVQHPHPRTGRHRSARPAARPGRAAASSHPAARPAPRSTPPVRPAVPARPDRRSECLTPDRLLRRAGRGSFLPHLRRRHASAAGAAVTGGWRRVHPGRRK